jgi:hypothetical protein
MIIIDWSRLGRPIEPVPGSHFNFIFQIFGLQRPSSVPGAHREVSIKRIVTGSTLWVANSYSCGNWRLHKSIAARYPGIVSEFCV